MLNKNKLYACACATTLSLSLFSATPVMAQDAPAIADNEIVTTGSRIKRTNAQSAVPLQVVGDVAIEEFGTNDLAEGLTEIPGISFGISPRESNNQIQTAGLSTISLRRLGDARTLTLINGKRAVSNSGNSDRVSLSTIAAGMVKRTEVTTGGASAIYGSDAIAGVANFILEDSFEGLELDTSYSIPEASGGEELEIELTYGKKFSGGKGYILLSGSYQDEKAIFADSTRPLSILPVEFDDPSTSSSNDFADEINTPGCDVNNEDRYCLLPSFSGSTPGGVFEGDAWVTRDGRFVNDQGGAFDPGDRTPGRDFFSDFDGYEFREGRTLEGEREIINIGAHSTYDLASNATFSITGLYSNVKSNTEGGFETLNDDDEYGANNEFEVGNISSSHPFIPPVVEETRSGSVSFDRRLVELGVQQRVNDRDTIRIMSDVTGTLDNGWDFEAFLTYGHFTQIQDNPNEVNFRNAAFALDIEDDGAGGFQCVDAAARADGCVPLNVFGLNSISEAAADYIRYNGHSEQRRSQITWGGNVRGDLFDIKPGAVKFAAGVEFRNEKQATIGDPDDPINVGGLDGDPLTTDDINISSFATFPTISAGYEVIEGFGELDIPIIKNKLNLQLAGRIGDYNTVGTIFSYNAGAVYTPIDGFKLRGQYSRSQRAPNISEFFSPARTDSDTIAGPCDGLLPDGTGLDALEGTGGADAGDSILGTVSANCLATPGIQAYFADPDQSLNDDGSIEPFDDNGGIRGPNAGNQNLIEETADTFTVGAVFRPAAIDGLTLIVDYYRIEIEDVITSISSQDQIDLCYASTDFPNSPFCAPITRNRNTGQVSEIVNQLQNLNSNLTEGIDATFRYDFEIPSVPGEIGLEFLYSHYFNDKTTFEGLNGPITETFLGEINTPKDEMRAKASYEVGPLRLTYTLSYEQGGVDDINNHPDPDDLQYYAVDDQFFHRIYARYDFGPDDNYRIYGGVNNIGNNFGPLLPTGLNNGGSRNIEEAVNRTVGREFRFGVRARF